MRLTKFPHYIVRNVAQTPTKGTTGDTVTLTIEVPGLTNHAALALVQKLYGGNLAVLNDVDAIVRDVRPGQTIVLHQAPSEEAITILDDGRSPIYLTTYVGPANAAVWTNRYDVMDRASDEVMASGLTLAEAKWEQGYHMGHRDAEAGR